MRLQSSLGVLVCGKKSKERLKSLDFSLVKRVVSGLRDLCCLYCIVCWGRFMSEVDVIL